VGWACLEEPEQNNKSSDGTKSMRKRPLGRSKTRWKDLIKNYVESLGGGSNWKEKSMVRERWRIGCEMGWS